MSIALYELSTSYMNVLNMIDEENTDTDIMNALTTIEEEIEAKAVNIANLIKSLGAEADAIKAEEQRLYKRRKSRENAVNNVKQYLQMSMEHMGIDKIKTPTYSIGIQNNPASVIVTNVDEIPGKFLTLVPEQYVPDRKRIAEALKAGEEVKGCELSRGRSLRIR